MRVQIPPPTPNYQRKRRSPRTQPLRPLRSGDCLQEECKKPFSAPEDEGRSGVGGGPIDLRCHVHVEVGRDPDPGVLVLYLFVIQPSMGRPGGYHIVCAQDGSSCIDLRN